MKANIVNFAVSFAIVGLRRGRRVAHIGKSAGPLPRPFGLFELYNEV
jgi:hypothetical protein